MTLTGEFDVAGVPPFIASAALAVALTDDLVIDLESLDFIDASGLGAVVDLNNLVTRRGHRLRLRHPRARVRRAFTLGGLSELLPEPPT